MIILKEANIMSDTKISAQIIKVPFYAWVILLVVFLASLAAPLNMAKIPPIMPVIMDAFQLSLGQGGMLMSVFAFTGMLLSLPAGILLRRYGPKKLGIFALGSLAVGSFTGASAGSYEILLLSRVIEGIGMGLIAVLAPAVIAMWFPAEKRGIPMGIWATWVPLGTVIIYVFAPAMVNTVSWKSVWWLGAWFSLIILVIYSIFLRLPPGAAHTSETDVKKTFLMEFAASMKDLNNRSIWFLGLTFGLFNMVSMGILTYYPTFLAEMRAYTLSRAALISSIPTIVVFFSAPLAGWLSDRLGSRRLVFSLPFLLISVLLLFPFRVQGRQIYTIMILQGLFFGAVPTAIFAAAPEIMKKPELAGLGMSVVMLGQNLGIFIGPVVFGKLVENLGWLIAGYVFIPVCLLGFFISWKMKVR